MRSSRAAWRAAAAMTAGACNIAGMTAGATSCKSSKKEPAPPKSFVELNMSLCLKGRHVFLNGHVDDDSAKAVITMLMYLEQEAPGVPIRLHINSGGGKVQAGLAIHDMMQALTSPVHTVCHGNCASISAVLLVCGAAGERAAAPNARIMIHQPVRTGGTKSNAREMQIQADNIERTRVRLAELLALRTGKPSADIDKLLEYDTYCDPHTAMQLGLIDRILTTADVVPLPPLPPPSAPQVEAMADDEKAGGAAAAVV